MKSVEILNISTYMWDDGPNLQKANCLSALVASDLHDSSVIAYLVAGDAGDGVAGDGVSSEIYSLPRTLTQWQRVGHLKKKRWYHVALSVPSNIIPGCSAGCSIFGFNITMMVIISLIVYQMAVSNKV